MLLLALAAAPALANGQTTHTWITLHALDYLPEGELKEFLTREDLQQALLNGAMFPDGGYPQHDDYGEMAHWEPFQNRYRAWIVGQEQAPYSDTMAEHVAFLMGMASHGMADQVYDSLYMERAKQNDSASDWGAHSMDEATDVAYAAIFGPMPTPEDWVPYDQFLQLYTEAGHPVSYDLLSNGQKLLRVAIGYVGLASQNPDTVANYADWFPWACGHQDDPLALGDPDWESQVIAHYWQDLWAQMQGGESAYAPVMFTFPADGYQVERDHSRIEGRVSLVFSRGIDTNALDPALFSVHDAKGNPVAVEVSVFYGNSSHVVHLIPQADWAENTDYTVTVAEGVPHIDGSTSVGYQFDFTTRPPPEVQVEPQPEKGCNTAGTLSLWGLLPALAFLRRKA